jgi:hypothetical protein
MQNANAKHGGLQIEPVEMIDIVEVDPLAFLIVQNEFIEAGFREDLLIGDRPLHGERNRFSNERAPLAACTEMEALPAKAFSEAPSISMAIPQLATVNGLCGVAITPEGMPVRSIWTLPEKPFNGCKPT